MTVRTLFVTSEFAPYAKAGGLADAVASLATALTRRGIDVSVVMPRYASLPSLANPLETRLLDVPFGATTMGVAFHRYDHDGVELYLLEFNDFYDRPGIYGPAPDRAYEDNARRFAFFAHAALTLAESLDPPPTVIHSHDWPAAMVPAILESGFPGPRLDRSASVFSIHNLGHQGVFEDLADGTAGLPRDELRALHVESGGTLNFLRGAIRHADKIVTVSPRYALEIQQPRFGFGLHREIQRRMRDVTGILNGIDEDVWDPARDDAIFTPYDVNTLENKARNKAELQRELGLPVDPAAPLIGMVTRLVNQKGIVPLFEPGNSLVYRLCEELPIQFVILGSGESWCEREIETLSQRLPTFRGIVGYSEELAHRIEASADFFLMPSLYEPCGLNQMYSMRYGTVPIVTRTGGLADTVDNDSGFFIEEASAPAIQLTVQRAIDTYLRRPDRIDEMRRYMMKRDFSWDRSADAYAELYQETVSAVVAPRFSA